jgi:hypothetical protein
VFFQPTSVLWGGKIMSWKYKAAEGGGHERVDAAGSDLGYLVTGLLDMAIH